MTVPDNPGYAENPCGCKFVCRRPDACPRPDLTVIVDDDCADDEDLPGFQGWTRGGTPIQEF